MTVETLTSHLAPVLRQHHVVEAYLFGSAARREDTEHSDVDILVRFDKTRGLFAFVQTKLDLENAIGGRKVDLVQTNALHPNFQEAVINERIRII